MSRFVGRLDITPIGKRRWELLAGLAYHADDDWHVIIAPRGFTTDFASIPRALWWLYPPYGDTWGMAAVIHDYLYATQLLEEWQFPRKWADQMFLEGMIVLGANWFRRTVMYQAVRLCAGAAWKKHGERIADEEVKRTAGDLIRHTHGEV